MSGRMLYIHALSPVQNGTGRGSGVIDLPVARESTTGWPAIYASTIKGVLRDACGEHIPRRHENETDGEKRARQAAEAPHRAAFGPDVDEDPAAHAGGIFFTDARLLCFPARSLAGSFAWLTCPMALRRWERDHTLAGLTPEVTFAHTPADSDTPGILTGTNSAVHMPGQQNPPMVYLEDLDLRADTSHAGDVDELAGVIAMATFPNDPIWQGIFTARFGVVPDSIFTFLAETATDVSARIRIDDEKKTVTKGGLWYEEAIPAEAILAAPLVPSLASVRNGAVGSDNELMAIVQGGIDKPRQIGGNATVGRGLVWFRLANGAEDQP